jgi:hypothetical protein
MKKMYLLLFVSLVVLWASASPNNTNLKDRYETLSKQRAQVAEFTQMLCTGTSSRYKSATALTYLNKVTDSKSGYTNMSYNTNGKLLLLEEYVADHWDQTVNINQKLTFKYDTNGNETEYTLWYYDSFDEKLLLEEMTETTWDNQNRMLSEIEYEWDDDANQPIPTGKSTYTYSGLTATMEQMAYDPTLKAYIKETKMELTLNSQNQGLSAKIYNWDHDQAIYVYTGKMTNTYNSKGELVKTVITGIDKTNNQEVVAMNFELVYNSKGLLIKEVNEMNFQGEMVPISESRYEYNSNDRLIKAEDYILNWMSGESMLSERNEYDYENNQLKEERVYQPEWGTSELALTYKYQFTYQADNNALNIARPNTDYVDMFFGYEYFESGRLLKVRQYEWDNETEQVDFNVEKTFHYSNNPGTGIKRLEASTLKAYPVPFDSHLNIETGANSQKQATLYSAQGQRLLHIQLEQQATLQTGHLPSGIYVLEVIDPNGTKQVHRIVKKSIN